MLKPCEMLNCRDFTRARDEGKEKEGDEWLLKFDDYDWPSLWRPSGPPGQSLR
jgi:hypothetical protein